MISHKLEIHNEISTMKLDNLRQPGYFISAWLEEYRVCKIFFPHHISALLTEFDSGVSLSCRLRNRGKLH